MYFGSLAEAMPASKIPNLVIAEAATSDAPDSAETARLREQQLEDGGGADVLHADGVLSPADTVDERRGAVGARISECYGQVRPLRGLWTSTRGIEVVARLLVRPCQVGRWVRYRH